jgi:prepilin-type N-terminal cleavage/methylation domain-containing protein
MARHTRRPGLTLLEVLLVMAILITLAAVAYPTLSAMYGDVRVKAAADQVRASWTEARAKAIEDGRAYRFAVETGTSKYRVAPDAPEFWDGSGGGPTDENAPPPLVDERQLPNGILFETPADLPVEGNWSTVAVFHPDGSCEHDIEITLKEDDDSTPIVVKVRAMTGAISVRKKTEGR